MHFVLSNQDSSFPDIDIAFDNHRPFRDIERRRRAFHIRKHWYRKLTITFQEFIEQIDQNRLRELTQFEQLFRFAGQKLRRGCWSEFQFGDSDRAGDVGFIQFWHEFASQYRHIDTTQQFSFVVFLVHRSVQFQKPIGCVEKATIFRMNDNRRCALIRFEDDVASVVPCVILSFEISAVFENRTDTHRSRRGDTRRTSSDCTTTDISSCSR